MSGYYCIFLALVSFCLMAEDYQAYNVFADDPPQSVGTGICLSTNTDLTYDGTNGIKLANALNRLYFYKEPAEDKQFKNLFVIKGDLLRVYNSTNKFSYVSFYNPKTGQEIFGWVKSDELIDYNPSLPFGELDYSDFIISDGKYSLNIYDDTHLLYTQNWKDDINTCGVFNEVSEYVDYKYEYDDLNVIVDRSYVPNRTEELYVYQLDILTHRFKTARGITIGDSYDKVISVYGTNFKNDEIRGRSNFDQTD